MEHGARGNVSMLAMARLGICAIGAIAGEHVLADEAGPMQRADLELAEVIVTGSRIPIDANGGTTPIARLDRQDIDRGGLDSLGRVLQALPFNTGAPMNSNVNAAGDGSERLDLRGLGPKRTLILLNGRRFPNGGLGGDDSVDVSAIPLSLVDHIEVLTSGASAIYGADAVAGVVNIVTRNAAPGLEIRLKDSVAERGDGQISSGQLVAGREIAGGSWVLGADFAHQRPVLLTARDYSAVPMPISSPDGTRMPGGTRPIPDGNFVLPDVKAFGLEAGSYVRIPGTSGQSAANYRPRTDSDVFVRSPYTYLQTPNQRGSLWLLGSQPLSYGMTLFAEGLWHQRRSSQRDSPAPIFSGLSPLPTLADGTQGIPATNWYNPFGVDIKGVYRRLVELPDRTAQQRIESWRALVGVRGTWRGWHWEAAAASAQSRSRSDAGGLPSALRLIPALGPSGPDATGHIVCGARDTATGMVPTANIIAGCVPLDLFDGAGSITREQVDYLNVSLRDRGSGSNRLLDFSAEGPLGELPAGPLRWALGAEYRRESGSYRLDPLRKAGVTGDGIPPELQGASFDVHEIYLEGRVPLLQGRSPLGALDVSMGVRHSNFSSFGADSTWQAGLRWQPLSAWSMRASYAQVFRAPDLSELFQSRIVDSVFENDPCGNDPTPAQRRNCAAHGVPGGVYQQDPSIEWNQLFSGNPNLLPERGVSFDAGIDLRPGSLPGLHLSVDFFNVDLDGFIESPSVHDVLLECADRGSRAACGLIHRAGNGTLQQVDVPYRNLGRSVASGYDIAGGFNFRAGSTRFDVGGAVTLLARRDSQLFRGGSTLRLAGTTGYPRWRANAHLDASTPGWRISYSLQFIGAQSQCESGLDQTSQIFCFPIATALYHDLDGAVKLLPDFELRAGVLNLTNRDPPYVNVGGPNTDVATYRLLGRTYFASLQYRF